MMSIEKILQAAPVVPVVVIENIEDAVPLANALFNGGLRALEITLRTPVAVEAIKQIKQAIPEAFVGTGTVIDKATFNASLEAGADFMVSPGVNDELLELASTSEVPFLPGAATNCTHYVLGGVLSRKAELCANYVLKTMFNP